MPANIDRVDGIDGLRAIAMTMVVAQHCSLLPFGWTGVWLFYVISGYVITRGFLVEADGGTPVGQRYSDFVWRRFLRIVPVYLLYLLLNVVVLASIQNGQKLGDLPYLLSFTYNWHMVFNFWPGGGGWGPFGHLWTLIVEQQFYLLFPLLALLVPDRWQTRTMLVMVCLGPVLRWQWSSWLAMRGMPTGDLAFAVYSATHCHFDAFLAGALVARLQTRGNASPAFANKLGVAALTVAACYACFYVGMNYDAGKRGSEALRNVYSGILDGGGREVWVYAAVDLLAAAALMHVLLGRAGTRWLSFRPVVWVGRVSYGAYLFHAFVLWCIGSWLGKSMREAPVPERLAVFVAAWVVTVGLASISFRWFEGPLARRWRNALDTTTSGATPPRRARA